MFILDSPRFISLNTILAACSLERKAFALHITPGMCFGGFNTLYLFYSKISNSKTASGFATFANFLLDINLYIWLILISFRDFAFSFANVTYPKRYMQYSGKSSQPRLVKLYVANILSISIIIIKITITFLKEYNKINFLSLSLQLI